MPKYPSDLAAALARVQRITPVSVDDYDGSGEWLCLESEDLWDYELFAKLSRAWLTIAGPFNGHFALIYCENDPDSGVWIHHLADTDKRQEYLCGCHRLSSWF